MENYNKIREAVWNYRPSPKDALATLKFYYSLRPTHEDTTGEKFAERAYREALQANDLIYDDDGTLLVQESIDYITEEIDDLFYYEHTAGFVRTMNRTKKFKEDLMAAAWHPRRIERLLELGGEEALDNFAGL